MNDLDKLCSQIQLIKLAKKKQEALLSELEGQLLSRLDEIGVSSLTTEDGRRVTKVTSSTKEWDLVILKDLLEPLGLWDTVRILREEVDREKLEVMLDRREVSEEQLSAALTVKPRKPYPKIS